VREWMVFPLRFTGVIIASFLRTMVERGAHRRPSA